MPLYYLRIKMEEGMGFEPMERRTSGGFQIRSLKPNSANLPNLVLTVGLEPTLPKESDFKSDASTDFTMPAL